jgi:D-glycero-alpha-D-manno-heptose 1-phosphate guanylyltransferase
MLEAIVLAGGLGTRLRGVVSAVPKPMAPIAGRPFLEYQLRFLCKQGFERVILSVGYLHESIISHFGDRFRNIALTYVVEPHALGTGGAIKKSLAACKSEMIFIFNGDTFVDVNCKEITLLSTHTERPVLVGLPIQNATRYGVLDTLNGTVVGLRGNSESRGKLINAGCYYIPQQYLDSYRGTVPFSFENDLLSQTLHLSPFSLHIASGLFIDIGVPNDYALAQQVLPLHFDENSY